VPPSQECRGSAVASALASSSSATGGGPGSTVHTVNTNRPARRHQPG